MALHKNSIVRFLRYALVGGSTLLFDLLLLTMLTELVHIPYYVSTPLAFLVAVSVNYFISRAFVFVGTERNVHHGYLYFIIIAITGALVTTGLVTLLVQYAHLYYLVARVAVAGIVGIGNYLFNLYINFRVVGKHQ
jgi:putative flippase GtrA